jgi:hypothetical protein
VSQWLRLRRLVKTVTCYAVELFLYQLMPLLYVDVYRTYTILLRLVARLSADLSTGSGIDWLLSSIRGYSKLHLS